MKRKLWDWHVHMQEKGWRKAPRFMRAREAAVAGLDAISESLWSVLVAIFIH